MRIFFCLFLSMLLFLSFSCSNAEAQKLRKELAMQKANTERLKDYLASTRILLDETRGKLSKALTEAQEAAEARDALLKELDGAKKTSLEATEKLEALAARKRVQQEPQKVVEAEPADDPDWFKRLPDGTKKLLKAYEPHLTQIATQEEAFNKLSMVLIGRDSRIRELMIERDFFQRKFQELMALKNQYEDALARMKADGIDTDKYLKRKK